MDMMTIAAFISVISVSYIYNHINTVHSSISSPRPPFLHCLVKNIPSTDSNSGLPDSRPAHYQLGYTAPSWATLHPSELCCTLLSYASPYWAMLHPTELYAAHWTELRCTLSELHCTLFQISFRKAREHCNGSLKGLALPRVWAKRLSWKLLQHL